jgi:hypothetical protein
MRVSGGARPYLVSRRGAARKRKARAHRRSASRVYCSKCSTRERKNTQYPTPRTFQWPAGGPLFFKTRRRTGRCARAPHQTGGTSRSLPRRVETSNRSAMHSNVGSGNVKMKCRRETAQEHQRSDADRVFFMFSAVEDRRPNGRWRRGGVTQGQRRISARR